MGVELGRRHRRVVELMQWTTATSRGSLADIHGFRGLVHLASPGSLYLAGRSPTADLLVVHDPSDGHTPTSVHVDRSTLSCVRPGQTVAGRSGYLQIGDLIVDLRHAAVWATPAARSMPRSAAGLARAGRQLKRRVPAPVPGLEDRMSHVLSALRDPDDGGTQSALTGLIGFGPGLTPSGDDAIIGLLGVLCRACPPNRAAPDLDRLRRDLPNLLERTTAISAHYLRLALRGAFSERLAALLDAIADIPEHGAPDEPGLDAAIEAVLAVGATSGADALAGVRFSLDAFADSFRRQHARAVA